jgi:hypothetical protein
MIKRERGEKGIGRKRKGAREEGKRTRRKREENQQAHRSGLGERNSEINATI